MSATLSAGGAGERPASSSLRRMNASIGLANPSRILDCRAAVAAAAGGTPNAIAIRRPRRSSGGSGSISLCSSGLPLGGMRRSASSAVMRSRIALWLGLARHDRALARFELGQRPFALVQVAVRLRLRPDRGRRSSAWRRSAGCRGRNRSFFGDCARSSASRFSSALSRRWSRRPPVDGRYGIRTR